MAAGACCPLSCGVGTLVLTPASMGVVSTASHIDLSLRAPAGEGRAADMEQIGGMESLIGWVQRTCAAEIKRADSWQALHATMAANGLTLHARGNGLVVTAQDGTSIKASSIGRDLSKKALETRLGAFQAADGAKAPPKPARAYEPRPIASKADTAELFARYKDQQASRGAARAAELSGPPSS